MTPLDPILLKSCLDKLFFCMSSLFWLSVLCGRLTSRPLGRMPLGVDGERSGHKYLAVLWDFSLGKVLVF